MARPAIALTDVMPSFERELRWPLGLVDHPELAPRYPIASALAEPGIGWIELCQRGAAYRGGGDRELSGYLRGWCRALEGDADGACEHLAPLLRSARRDLAAAVRADLSHILAAGAELRELERLLSRHGLGDPALLDRLAGALHDLGKPSESAAVTQRALDEDRPDAATRCRRLTRKLVLAGPPVHGELAPELHELVTAPDAVCRRLYHKLSCWLERPGACELYFDDIGVDPGTRALWRAYQSWPRTWAGPIEWWRTASHAIAALPLPGADELALAALDALSTTAWCDDWLRTTLSSFGDLVASSPSGAPDRDRRLALIRARCPAR